MFKINEEISDYDNTQNYIKYKNYKPKTTTDNVTEIVLAFWELHCLDVEEISLQDFLTDYVYDLKEYDYNC